MSLDMHDIGQGIYETSQQIQRGVKSLYGHAKAYAEAEHEYRLALAREIVRCPAITAQWIANALQEAG